MIAIGELLCAKWCVVLQQVATTVSGSASALASAFDLAQDMLALAGDYLK